MAEEGNTQLFSLYDKPEESSSSNRIHSYHVAHVYDIDENADSDGQPKRKRPTWSCCWNCGGSEHTIRQCPLPPNPREISRNKALFATRKSSEFKRYHVDSKEDKYPHLKPGVMSEKLREALGLREDQLPMHIYRMRVLGYPPGWLLEAKLDPSGIEMFDMDGNRVPNADEEEGEIGGGKISDYDETKIISYPGFNEWPPPDTLDETKLYGHVVPELKYLQSKEDFIKSLKNNQISAFPPEKKDVHWASNVEGGECDMETEDIEEGPALPEDKGCIFIPAPIEEPEDGELQDEECSDSSRGPREETGSPDVPEEVLEENKLSKLENSSHGRIVSIELGTPVLKIHSPFRKLPPPEAFKKDISDVINFENLPDSTGAYERLKGVLKNVRVKMTQLKEPKFNAPF